VLDGSATLEVDGTIESLESGDWVLLDEGVPHRVLSTRTGTSWLAVHLPPGAGGPAP
jgi:mannose-6-phosphate isomerase-like protein (cupin superfamily)